MNQPNRSNRREEVADLFHDYELRHRYTVPTQPHSHGATLGGFHGNHQTSPFALNDTIPFDTTSARSWKPTVLHLCPGYTSALLMCHPPMKATCPAAHRAGYPPHSWSHLSRYAGKPLRKSQAHISFAGTPQRTQGTGDQSLQHSPGTQTSHPIDSILTSLFTRVHPWLPLPPLCASVPLWFHSLNPQPFYDLTI
jgi:hypothetical protein